MGQPVNVVATQALDSAAGQFAELVRLTSTTALGAWVASASGSSPWEIAGITVSGDTLSASANQQLNSSSPSAPGGRNVSGSRIDNSKAIFVWKSSSSSMGLRIADYSSGTLTLGTEGAASFNSLNPHIVALSTTKSLLFFNGGATFGDNRAIIVTTSGTSISSVSSRLNYTTYTQARVGGSYPLSSSSALVVFGDYASLSGTANGNIYAMVVTESGGSLSGGTPTLLGTGYVNNFSITGLGAFLGPRYGVDLLPSGDYLVSWGRRDAPSSGEFGAKFAVVSVSGTTVTKERDDDLTASAYTIRPRGALVDGYFLEAWDGGGSNLVYVFPFAVASDGTVTAGTYASPDPVSTGTDDVWAIVATSGTRALVGYDATGGGYPSVRLVETNLRQAEWYGGYIRGVA